MTGLIVVYFLAATFAGIVSMVVIHDDHKYPAPRAACASIVIALLWPLIVLVLGVHTALKFAKEVW